MAVRIGSKTKRGRSSARPPVYSSSRLISAFILEFGNTRHLQSADPPPDRKTTQPSPLSQVKARIGPSPEHLFDSVPNLSRCKTQTGRRADGSGPPLLIDTWPQ